MTFKIYIQICKIHSLGTLSSRIREILIAQISNNVGNKEDEPSFLLYIFDAW